MSKNLFQDMVKIKRAKNEEKNITKGQPVDSILGPVQTRSKMLTNQGNRGRHQYALWFVAILSLVFFLLSLSYLFSRAVVMVNPKTQDFTLNENLSANKNGNIEALSFDLVIISGEENKIIQTTLEKDISQTAKGTVAIFNNFSSATQRLDINTRLEGSNGKIYKTEKAIIVPGMKGSTPGSIEVKIYGSEAGEEYNSAPLDFTIFGFKGTPKYSKFYARSTGTITGGFKGKVSVIPETEKTSVVNELKDALQTKLLKKATDQIPNGFILFKDAVFLNIDDSNINSTPSKDNILPIKLNGTLYGLLFDEQKLSKKIAENNITEYDDSVIFIPNIRDLTFSLSAQAGLSNKDNISFKEVKNINFNLSGAIKIVWKLDVNKLIADLLGKSKKDLNQILLQYPNIDTADVVIRPFWKRSFPDKTKDIKVIVNEPK